MTPQTAVNLFAAWVLVHILLARPNLNPTLRPILQTVENEELTRLISALPAA